MRYRDTEVGRVGVHFFYLCLPCMQFPKQFPKTWKINRNSGRLLIRNCLVEFCCFGVLHRNVCSKHNTGKLLSVENKKRLLCSQIKSKYNLYFENETVFGK